MLDGASLDGASLDGASLDGKNKIVKAIVFSGIYKYSTIAYIIKENEKRVKMGCFDRSLREWEDDFWNNDSEFPNNNSKKSNLRFLAFETAKKWFEVVKIES